jgi:eukaryotic-like serine/threonine-protein kinase
VITPGTRIGAYETGGELGSGGMGVVYRAHDVRLGRDVALKVLPAEFSTRPDRVARFRREARLLASLSHPHIAAIFGFEETEEVTALVLELVEGETLSERLLRGAIPLHEAVTIAQQIAEALEAAHDRGIIHRDLKPANIKLTPEGSVKVLDFGLAKVFESPSPDSEPLTSQTATLERTEPGMILGTVGYMSPEQARGEVADKRADIWAFGCVVYEMLTGRRTFSGASRSDVLAAVINQEPDWNALPPSTPQTMRTLLGRCLVKDRRRRLRDIGDAVLELEPAATPGWSSSDWNVTPSVGRRRSLWRIAAVVGVVLALLVAAAALTLLQRSPPAVPVTVRLSAVLPGGVAVTQGPGYASSLALSPDGRTVVIAGTGRHGLQLYQRSLDQLEMTPIAGTEGGSNPFFSPDGKWIGFFADGRLRRIPADGGSAVDIAQVPEHTFGASWGPDDRIVFVPGAFSALRVVEMSDGTVKTLAELADERESHYNPEISADGRIVFFDDGWSIHALDSLSGRRAKITEGTSPRYTFPGYLLFCRGTTILAAAFDPARLEITSQVVPLVDGIGDPASSTKHYAVSRSGHLAYVPMAASHSLVLIDPDGTEQLLADERPRFQNPQFSPDGRRIAVASSRRRSEPIDVWIYDLDTGASSRLTFEGGRAPVWTPDGSAITYSHLGKARGIYRKSADGSGPAERIVALEQFHWLIGWTPDGNTLAYGGMDGASDQQRSTGAIWASTGAESRYVVEPGSIWGGRLSPDGRWLAYYELETGSFEVYVTRFPEGGARWLISEGGGRDPSWSPDGKELYYRNGDRLVAAQIETSGGPRVLSRRVALEPFRPPLYDDYDIHPDGRTLVIVRPAGGLPNQAVLVLNWVEELKRAVTAN